MKKATLNKIPVPVCLVLLFLLFSCRTKKPMLIMQGPVDPFPTGLPERRQPASTLGVISPQTGVIDSLRKAQLEYKTLSFRAKGPIKVDDKENDVTVSIRIDKDKAIWASVTATIAQIELARVLITPDSVKIINRALEEYVEQPFSFLVAYTGSGTTFGTVQSLLTGSLLPGTPDGATVTKQNEKIQISGSVNGLAYLFTTGSDLKLSRIDLKNISTSQLLNAVYPSYALVGDKSFPASVAIVSTTTEGSASLTFDYSKILIDQPVEMPFSIPKKYKKITP